MEALVLTTEKADELGFSGAGPFTFGGLFPGEWERDYPLRVTELGFTDADEAEAALQEAFDEEVAPLKWVDVGEGEGYPERFNHVASEADVRNAASATGEAATEIDFDKIRTHADADKAAEALGISFGDGKPKLEEKIAALKATSEGAALDTTGDETRILTGNEGEDAAAGGGAGPQAGEHPADQAGPQEGVDPA